MDQPVLPRSRHSGHGLTPQDRRVPTATRRAAMVQPHCRQHRAGADPGRAPAADVNYDSASERASLITRCSDRPHDDRLLLEQTLAAARANAAERTQSRSAYLAPTGPLMVDAR